MKTELISSQALEKSREGSETIPKGSTQPNEDCGSGAPLTRNGEGDDIVRDRNKNKFIAKAIAKFGDKFDYSKVEYIDAKTKVKIICPIHGEFEQTPDKHLQSKWGCSQCSNSHRTVSQKARDKAHSQRTITKEEFI